MAFTTRFKRWTPFAALVGALALPVASIGADSPLTPTGDYAAVATQRAAKIVDTLRVDAAKASRVREIIARQYRELNVIHSERDAQLAEAKKLTAKAAQDVATTDARAAAETKLTELHGQYLARLATELTPEQIDQVKDGMTYGVLPLTYRVYQEMIPDLTPEQKKQILDWLTEAREHAMDGSTSHEKHAWFGKYKGRINNYLSKAGIDLKMAEKNLKK